VSAKDELKVPSSLYYTREHEWARISSDGSVLVGVTDFAQRRLHEVVFVDLPQVGSTVDKGGLLGTVESVKAVAEVFSPFAGEVIRVNDILTKSPELVNQDPYGKGWIARIRPRNLQADLVQLLTAEQYVASLSNIRH
jgi:glycine cleavage system H protein